MKSFVFTTLFVTAMQFSLAFDTLEVALPPGGAMLERDAARQTLIVKAWFYAAQNTADANRQLKAILSFWKKQSGRFQYCTEDGRPYTVCFDIQAAPGCYTKQGFFIPAQDLDLHYVHQIQIVPKTAMQRMAGRQTLASGGRIIGYTQQNFIYISADLAHRTWISVHESGHCLGIGHHAGGIMASNLDHCRLRLTQADIDQMIQTLSH